MGLVSIVVGAEEEVGIGVDQADRLWGHPLGLGLTGAEWGKELKSPSAPGPWHQLYGAVPSIGLEMGRFVATGGTVHNTGWAT